MVLAELLEIGEEALEPGEKLLLCDFVGIIAVRRLPTQPDRPSHTQYTRRTRSVTRSASNDNDAAQHQERTQTRHRRHRP